jgi:hypothetical protein
MKKLKSIFISLIIVIAILTIVFLIVYKFVTDFNLLEQGLNQYSPNINYAKSNHLLIAEYECIINFDDGKTLIYKMDIEECWMEYEWKYGIFKSDVVIDTQKIQLCMRFGNRESSVNYLLIPDDTILKGDCQLESRNMDVFIVFKKFEQYHLDIATTDKVKIGTLLLKEKID